MKRSLIATEIAKPYAEALMSLARDHNLTEPIGQDVNFLLDLLQESQELEQFLANPVIKREAKKAVLQQIVKSQVHPYVFNFLMLLLDRRRIVWLRDICQQYQGLLQDFKRITLAEVIAAVEPTEEQRQAIAERVKEIAGAEQVEIKTRIDPDVIGGFILKIGSQVIDLSICGQLRQLARTLTQ
jgi:F-type H+-transporting ATPase subunit delta